MAAGYSGAERTKSCRARLSQKLAFLAVLVLSFAPSALHAQPVIRGFRPREVERTTQDGVFVLTVGRNHTLLLFGEHLTNNTIVKFTDNKDSCLGNADRFGGGNVTTSNGEIASLEVFFDSSHMADLYFCVSENELPDHQGSEIWKTLVVLEATASSGSGSSSSLLPLPVEIIFILFLMVLSGLFSGLNLGLMALDPTTLKIIMESGTKRQRGYAKKIFRVRKRGNYLLCTLLLGNVLVNSTLTILLDTVLGSGVYAVIASTMAIVIFGEIIPQAICSRYGLFIGAHTIYLTYFFMFLTFPLSFPISLILNCILGKEIGAVYNREQLLELLKVTKDHHGIAKDEVNMISGALEFKTKTAEDVMTKYEDVYCLDVNGVLNFKTMREIFESGFSRIPVYEGDKQNVIGLLYVRDLAFVDADDETPLSNVLNFYSHEVRYVFNDSKLDEMFVEFSEGKCHMAIVKAVVTETEGDPFYEIVGVVTLEDIVEEILQREIVDETDRFMDNRTLKPRVRKQNFDLDEFVDPTDTNLLSSQQQLAIYQFLSTGVEPFKEQYVSQAVLKRLLQKNVVHFVSLEDTTKNDHSLYKAGMPASYFTLVLEGCVKVLIGKDQLEFETRSFSHFGAEALLVSSGSPTPGALYFPDYTVRPTTDCQVLIITRSQYLAACKATKFEQEKHLLEGSRNESKSDVFAREWERAETRDLESRTGSELPPITRMLPRKSVAKRRPVRKQVSIEHRPLLNGHSSSLATSSNPSESTDDEGTLVNPLLCHLHQRDPADIEMGALRHRLSGDGTTGTSSGTPPSSVRNVSPVFQIEMQDFPGEVQFDNLLEVQSSSHEPAEPLPRPGREPQAAHRRTSTPTDAHTSSDV